MMLAIYLGQLYRVIDDSGTGVRLEKQGRHPGKPVIVGYSNPLLVLDPTDDDVARAQAGQFHHQDEWGRDLCCKHFDATIARQVRASRREVRP